MIRTSVQGVNCNFQSIVKLPSSTRHAFELLVRHRVVYIGNCENVNSAYFALATYAINVKDALLSELSSLKFIV